MASKDINEMALDELDKVDKLDDRNYNFNITKDVCNNDILFC